MSPKPKSVPPRLVPPPQLAQLSRIPIVQQQAKFQPKMREILAKQATMIARWLHETLTWKKILMSWMVLLVASKMVLLMLTYEFFSLTALISLQVGQCLIFKLMCFYISFQKISRTIANECTWKKITYKTWCSIV